MITVLLSAHWASAKAQPDEKWSIPVTVFQSEKEQGNNAQERLEDRAHDVSDLEAQWLAARSAEAMVTLSWIQMWLTCLTFAAALYSVKLARDTFVSENRPVLIPNTPELPSGISSDQEETPYKLMFKNHGRGAAFVRSYRFAWSSTPREGFQKMRGTSTPAHWPVPMGTEWGMMPSYAKECFPLGQRLQIIKGEEELFLFVEVEYAGSSRKRYVARAAWVWLHQQNRFIPFQHNEWWR